MRLRASLNNHAKATYGEQSSWQCVGPQARLFISFDGPAQVSAGIQGRATLTAWVWSTELKEHTRWEAASFSFSLFSMSSVVA